MKGAEEQQQKKNHAETGFCSIHMLKSTHFHNDRGMSHSKFSKFAQTQANAQTAHISKHVKTISRYGILTKISQGRPKYRWEDNIKQDICQLKIKNWIACVQNRGKWKEVTEKAKTFNETMFSAWKKIWQFHFHVM
jgi:hypothetical protein